MEVLDRDLLNIIADFEEEVLRNQAEEEMFDKAMRNWEMNAVFDDVFGG